MDDLPVGTPHWVQVAYGAAIFVMLLRQHINSRRISNVNKEVNNNGGKSLKDNSDKSMLLVEKIDRRLSKAETRLTELKDWFARDRLHAGRQDWNTSELKKELEAYEKHRNEEIIRGQELDEPLSGD